MQYLITFSEGIISFVSPCMLPLLPLYISYFSGHANKKTTALLNVLCFIAGFTSVFCLLGFFAGGIGELLHEFHGTIDLICGIVIILLGLDFLGIIHLPVLGGGHSSQEITGKFSAFVLGVIFSISHAPCLSAWLGTALATASASGAVGTGVLLLLVYSLGLAVPFIISAFLLERLGGLFEAINKHYRKINLICGILLILLGLLMASGLLHKLIH